MGVRVGRRLEGGRDARGTSRDRSGGYRRKGPEGWAGEEDPAASGLAPEARKHKNVDGAREAAACGGRVLGMVVGTGAVRGRVHPPQHPSPAPNPPLFPCPLLPVAAPGDYSKVVTLALEVPGGWDLDLGAAAEGSAAPYLATAAFGHVPPLLAFAAGAVGQGVDAAEFGRLVQVRGGGRGPRYRDAAM